MAPNPRVSDGSAAATAATLGTNRRNAMTDKERLFIRKMYQSMPGIKQECVSYLIVIVMVIVIVMLMVMLMLMVDRNGLFLPSHQNLRISISPL
jgi:hypothetical protein